MRIVTRAPLETRHEPEHTTNMRSARFTRVLLSLVLGLAGISFAACGDDAPDAAPPPVVPESTAEAAPGASAPPSGPRAEGTEFVLTASSAGAVTAGQPAQLAIELVGRNDWHVNAEYPFSVQMSTDAPVSVPEARLGRGDAAEFGEEKVRLLVPITASAAGTHEVRAFVRFAMCTEGACLPMERTLSLPVNAS